MVSGCNCRQCRARVDARFWDIVNNLGPGIGYSSDDLDPGDTAFVERVKWYTDAPRARSAEDFEQWLNQILTRVQRKEGN